MTGSNEVSGRVDVLVLAALQMEFDAARKVMTTGYQGSWGVATWNESDSREAAPCIIGDYVADTGLSLRIALARPRADGVDDDGDGRICACRASSTVLLSHVRGLRRESRRCCAWRRRRS